MRWTVISGSGRGVDELAGDPVREIVGIGSGESVEGLLGRRSGRADRQRVIAWWSLFGGVLRRRACQDSASGRVDRLDVAGGCGG
jgi:hypothetical protein